MKRFISILSVIAMLCSFCAVGVLAADSEQLIAVEVEVGDQLETHTVDTAKEVPGSRVNPTCTEDGWVDYYCTEEKCAAENLWHRVTLPALGHNWSTKVENEEWGDATEVPTCQQSGTAVEYCTRCDATGATRVLDAIPHDFSKVVVDVDNCEEFKWHYECAYGCGTAETEINPQTGKEEIKYHVDDAKPYEEGPLAGELKHDWTDWSVEVEPTCCEEGTMTRACVICGAKQARSIEKLDHNYVLVDKHLDDCETITLTYECTECAKNRGCACEGNEKGVSAVYTEEVHGIFHQWEFVRDEEGNLIGVEDETTPENESIIDCTHGGLALVQCKWCEEYDTVKVPPLGHDWSEWTLEKTFVKNGEEVGFYTRTCNRCGGTEELISAESPNAAPENPDVPGEPTDPTEPEEPEMTMVSVSAAAVEQAEDGTLTGEIFVDAITGDASEVEYIRMCLLYEMSDGSTWGNVVMCTPVKGVDGVFNVTQNYCPDGATLIGYKFVPVSDGAASGAAYSDYLVSFIAA